MKAMILAAGLGTRMRPLTDHTPKPLLPVGGKPLLGWHIERLVAAGIREMVVNTAHLGEQIADYCGDGGAWGAAIALSPEPEPLETAGGIVRALPLLGEEPFLVVNGDVWTDYPFAGLAARPVAAGGAHLVLVDNPVQHPLGDFQLAGDGRLRARPPHSAGLTFSGIAVYDPGFFDGVPDRKAPLRPLMDSGIAAGRLSGEHYRGQWDDIGTPERLAALDARLGAA
ncbi:N-acetylmuramate alpha-1-phosphate uridylyltransferase MurU [Parahaliea mediterranea]|uniref:Nucleotidyltransferase family protein n=1 Tax=Parahaliea mediterranea TaxID=651086 RepID=A0A939DGQ7_9GAMM|nr:nucleotidyltransferase family protein [Parahaliea mediterranea]MBN7797769.1 nucleotidyltransferase family protein [Parahaliea mediterranea]